MGALTVTSVSTFTSCKDYDSDISNLQGQIDKAALSTDVQSLKTQVETAASNASTAATSAEDAMKKAIAANDAVNGVVSSIGDIQGDLDELADAINTNADAAASLIDSLANAGKAQDSSISTNAGNIATNTGKIADIKTEITKLQTANKAAADSAASALAKNKQLSKDLENAIKQWGQSKDGYYTAAQIDAKLDSLKDAIAQASDDSIASLKTVVNGYKTGINALYTAVTGVSLVIGGDGTAFSTDLHFEVGTINTPDGVDLYTFGKDEVDDKAAKMSATPTKEYKKGGEVRFANTLLVRVNPVNANITKDMVKLVDAQGNDLSNTFDITKVERYNEQITKASSESGLWKVTIEVKEGVKNADIEKKTADGDSHICYAVAVNNTASQAEAYKDAADRYVVSAYDVTIGENESYEAATGYLSNVKIKAASASEWSNVGDLKATAANVARKSPLYVQNGENILISFDAEELKNVDRFYVVRDDSHAGDDASDASELNAWKKYGYKGLGEVVAVEKGAGKDTLQISIPADAKVGDEIQFRMFAINYDGSLVENYSGAGDIKYNGKSFRVYVGAKTTTVTAVGALKPIATNNTTFETGWLEISGELTNNELLEKTSVTLKLGDLEIPAAVAYAKDANGTAVGANDKIKYVKLTINNSQDTNNQYLLTKWTNGAAATGVIEDDNQPVVNSIGLSITKNLPTAEDFETFKKYTWKDNQKEGDTYTCYVYPYTSTLRAAWTTPYSDNTGGYKNMVNAITDLYANNSITIANAKADNDGKYTENLDVDVSVSTGGIASAMNLAIPAQKDAAGTELIDGKTKHASTIYYNFGYVNSDKPSEQYKVAVETYNTIFACPLEESVQKLDWVQYEVSPATDTKPAVMGDGNYLTYGSTTTVVPNLFTLIKSTNSFDNTEFGKQTLAYLLAGDNPKYVSCTAELLSKGSNKADYYTATVSNGAITFTEVSGTSNPTADVASTLVIKLTDAFGHVHVYKLPFTVKKA